LGRRRGGVDRERVRPRHGISIDNANAGSGNAHNNIQPTIIVNYLLRVL
jgi:microcystin-dependent protein